MLSPLLELPAHPKAEALAARPVGQEPRPGQRRTKSAPVRQERCLLWRTPAAKDRQGRSNADTTLLLWPLVRRSPPSELAAFRELNARAVMLAAGEPRQPGRVGTPPGFGVAKRSATKRGERDGEWVACPESSTGVAGKHRAGWSRHAGEKPETPTTA
jgi:hypothetical protein